MPFALLIVGGVLVVTGVRGTSSELFSLVEGDFTGQNNFVYWALSILVLGSLGYVDALRGLSRALLILVLIVLVIANDQKSSTGGGFFTQFQNAISSITKGS